MTVVTKSATSQMYVPGALRIHDPTLRSHEPAGGGALPGGRCGAARSHIRLTHGPVVVGVIDIPDGAGSAVYGPVLTLPP